MSNRIRLKGNKDTAIDLASGTLTTVVALTDGQAAFDDAFSNDTIGTTVEDGYIQIDLDGTTYKIPFWADD